MVFSYIFTIHIINIKLGIDVLGKILEKVMVKNAWYSHEKLRIDRGTVEDIIYVAAAAMQLLGKPINGMRFGLFGKYLFDKTTDVDHDCPLRHPEDPLPDMR